MASTNRGKVGELVELAGGLGIMPICLDQLSSAPPPVAETEDTFVGNALLKAHYYHQRSGLLTLADDSGLEVYILGGRPGVRSAEYGGVGLSSSERNSLLLHEMRSIPLYRRGARFVCALALVGKGLSQTFIGSCEGEISLAPHGKDGFGYDPIFIDRASGLTFAELSRDEKSERSHRGKAMSDLLRFLRATQLHNPGSPRAEAQP